MQTWPPAPRGESWLAPGSVAIRQRDDVVGAFQPPVAWDKDRERIDVGDSGLGKTVVVHCPQRPADVHYPLVVDPRLTVSESVIWAIRS